MLFQIRHTTHYRYSCPVSLGPHWIRMRPHSNGVQQLVSFEQTVTPRPAGASECLDAFGNAATRVWFTEPTQSLTVKVEFVVKTDRENPYDYLLPPDDRLALSALYSPAEVVALAPFLHRTQPDPTVTAFAQQIAGQAGGHATRFLSQLTDSINSRTRHCIREEGDPFPPERTLAEGAGSCRDLAVLFVDACRTVGLAARFASGYLNADPVRDRRYLHAWAEAYLPDAGWRGYDPSHRVAVADRHVLVAVAPEPADAAPIAGAYWGPAATGEMHVKLDISARPTISHTSQAS